LDLGPVEVGAKGFYLPVALQVAECDAPPGTLQEGLVACEPVQVQWGGQLGLVEHDHVGFLFSDQPVQVLLLLGCVDASNIPQEDLQGYFANV
jgi:hypothetical protein